MPEHSAQTIAAGAPIKDNSLVERLLAATEVLEAAVGDRALLAVLSAEDRFRLIQSAGAIFCPDVGERRRLIKARQRQRKSARLTRDQNVLSATGIRTLRRKPVITTPNVFPPQNFQQQEVEVDPALHDVIGAQNCYICKQDYSAIHHFYDQLCPPCAELNFRKRTESADLRGRVALLTGGRVKIGYQAGIKLLRAGAQLIITTRFPRDSAARYAQEPAFPDWGHRLAIFGLDLRT